MNKRNSKHFKIKNDSGFKIQYGTYNKLNPDVIHINGKTWMMPCVDNIKIINDNINIINKKIITLLINKEYFDVTNFIFDIDYANTQLVINKKSFLTFDLFLKQKNSLKIDNEDINKEIEILSNNVINTIIKKLNNTVIFYKEKK